MVNRLLFISKIGMREDIELKALQSEVAYKQAQASLDILQSLTSTDDILRFIATQLIYIRQELNGN